MSPAPAPGLPARYQPVRRIGSGGMGEVWLADDTGRGVRVAVKKLRLLGGEAAEADRLRFRREFLLLSRLALPRVVRAFDFGEWEEGLYYSMEHVEGWPLAQYLRDGRWAPGGPPTPDYHRHPAGLAALWGLADELLQALAELHAAGLIHRDLKPGNVMVSGAGALKLIDFGLARTQAADPGVTAAGEVMGTPAYLSPEQIRNLPLDGRSDLYSAGVMLYELGTGRPPLSGASVAELLLAHLQVAPPDPAKVNPAIGPPLSAFLLRLLSKEPAGRPPSAEDARAALRIALGELSGAGALPTVRLESMPDERPAALLRAGFTGNGAALAALDEALAALASGRGSALVVSGASGAGKSRWVEELRARAAGRGLRVAVGGAREEGNLNAQAFQGVMADLSGLLAAEPGLCPREDAATLAHHFPALRRVTGFADPAYRPLEEAGERGRLLLAFGNLFSRLAGRTPLAVVVEDLHWADPLSLEMASLLVNNFTGESPSGGAPLLVAANHREEEPGPAARWRERLPAGAIRLVRLQALDEPGLAELIRALLGLAEPPPPEFARRLLELTGGNPLYLTETLRVLVESGELRRTASALEGSGGWNFAQWLRGEAGRGASLPASLQAAAARRLADFPPEQRVLLQAAALLGKEFGFGRWASLSGEREDDLLEVAERALRAGLLEEAAGERLRFVHDQMRAALLEGLSGLRRRRLHARLVEILSAPPGPGDERVALVRHAVAAGDAAVAAAHGDAAVQELLDFSRLEEARGLIAGLEALLPGGPAGGAPLVRLLQKKILLLGRLGDLETGLAVAGERLALAERLGDPELVMDGHYWCAFIRLQTGDTAGALEHARASLAAAPAESRPGPRSRQRQILGAVMLQLGRIAEAEAETTEAIALAEAHGEPRQLAWAVNSLATIRYEAGDLAAAAGGFARAAEIAGAGGYAGDAATMTNNLGEALLEQGRLAEAERRLREGLRVQLAAGAMFHAADPTLNLGRLLRLRGDEAGAARAIGEALEWAERAGHAPLIGRALLEQAQLAAAVNDRDGARRLAAEALARCERSGWEHGLNVARATVAALLLRLGDAAAAQPLAASAAAATGTADQPALHALAVAARECAAALLGRAIDPAALDSVPGCATGRGGLEASLQALLLCARARLALGDAAAARVALRRARELPGFPEFLRLAEEHAILSRQCEATG